jgi:hypothetical protein
MRDVVEAYRLPRNPSSSNGGRGLPPFSPHPRRPFGVFSFELIRTTLAECFTPAESRLCLSGFVDHRVRVSAAPPLCPVFTALA